MEDLALTFFPFPHVVRGERRDGSVTQWPRRCLACADRQCERSTESGLRLCSYGLNYERVDQDLLVAGLVVRDYPGPPTDARKRALKRAHVDGVVPITRAQLARTLAQGAAATLELQNELQQKKDAIIADYRASKAYEADVVDLLRPELQQSLAQVHDYKTFVQQITQNLDVILETQFPGEPIEDKLRKARREETAIYWAAQLMDEQLDAALYLLYPERLHEPRHQGAFRFHGLVTKYRNIYQSQIDSKRLSVRSVGESWGIVRGNSRAISIIPHAFIDNAVKYAPENTTITLAFEEADDTLRFCVESFGPRISDNETPRVFELFFRGEEARRVNTEGTGFGLASAQNVARAFGLPLSLSQDSARTRAGGAVYTVASVVLPLERRERPAHPPGLDSRGGRRR